MIVQLTPFRKLTDLQLYYLSYISCSISNVFRLLEFVRQFAQIELLRILLLSVILLRKTVKLYCHSSTAVQKGTFYENSVEIVLLFVFRFYCT